MMQLIRKIGSQQFTILYIGNLESLHEISSQITFENVPMACLDPYHNPSGWWLTMWTYRKSQNFAVNIFEVTTLLTKHIFDEMSCIDLENTLNMVKD